MNSWIDFFDRSIWIGDIAGEEIAQGVTTVVVWFLKSCVWMDEQL